MKFHFSIPWSIRVVAYLFTVGGFFHLLGFMFAFLLGDSLPFILNPSLGIEKSINLSNIFIGTIELSIAAGLISFSRFWRFMALAFIAVKATAAITVGLLVLVVEPMTNGNISQSLFGWNIFDITASNLLLMPILLAITLVYYGLQWWAVDRSQVRSLFFRSKAKKNLQPA